MPIDPRTGQPVYPSQQAAPMPQAPSPMRPGMQGMPGQGGQLTPEVLQQLMAMGALDDKGAALEEQMALAQAMRQGSGKTHTTALGGAFGAIGDTLNAVNAKRMMDEVKTGREGISRERTAGRESFAKLLGF